MISFQHDQPQLDFGDVLLVPSVSKQRLTSRSDVNLLHPMTQTVPIIVANMDSIGTFDMAKHLQPFQLMVALLKDFTVADWEREMHAKTLSERFLIPTMGTRDFEGEIERIRSLTTLFPQIPFVCLDVANGYLPMVADAVKSFKDALPHVRLCAGNVVDAAGVRHLAQAGADIIKIGIGSGGVCLTRMKTGVGYPQFSAVQYAAMEARSLGVEIVSDGGITCVGDFAKGFAAGADFVMAGSFFAGHEETGVHFHGMSSDRSRTARGEEVLDYRASEGREVTLHPKGSLAFTLRDLLGGLRSSCTYLGTSSLHELTHGNIQAIQVNRQLNRIAGIAFE